MNIYVKNQAELDVLPLDTKDDIYINFGTKEKPAIVKKQYRYPVIIINSVVAIYDNSFVDASDNSMIHAYGDSEVHAYSDSKVFARDNSKVYAHHNSEVCACNNSKVSAYDSSKIYAYDNSKVYARNSKNIVSINDNAIVTSPSILCSGAELLNQCNGNIGNIKFAVLNIPDDNKKNVFDNFCCTDDFSKRAFVLTMQNTPYYCIYNPDTMSVGFYTMTFGHAFKNIADNTVFIYYIDNILMPALVNTKFDKNAKSNII